MDRIREWITNWFLENGNVAKNELEDKKEDNYIELGWIDSFGFIQLVSEIEAEFEMEFNDSDYENDKFLTIEGLVDIVGEHIDE